MKLWQKNKDALKEVSQFTVGQDKELDLFLAPFDVIGSLAHIQMLASIGLLEKTERDRLAHALKEIYKEIQNGGFKIDEGVEDIHSQVELMLTARLGALGKKSIVAARATTRYCWTLNYSSGTASRSWWGKLNPCLTCC